MMPVSEITTPPASSLSKATSAVYLKPLENQPIERPPSGTKPQHQQVARLSQQQNTGTNQALFKYSIVLIDMFAMKVSSYQYFFRLYAWTMCNELSQCGKATLSN